MRKMFTCMRCYSVACLHTFVRIFCLHSVSFSVSLSLSVSLLPSFLSFCHICNVSEESHENKEIAKDDNRSGSIHGLKA